MRHMSSTEAGMSQTCESRLTDSVLAALCLASTSTKLRVLSNKPSNLQQHPSQRIEAPKRIPTAMRGYLFSSQLI